MAIGGNANPATERKDFERKFRFGWLRGPQLVSAIHPGPFVASLKDISAVAFPLSISLDQREYFRRYPIAVS